MRLHPLARLLWKASVWLHVALYRLFKGHVPLGKHTIIITTIGRKSGQARSRALVAAKDGDDFIVIASFGGSLTHPDWYLNLRANPQVTVEDRGRTLTTTAHTVTDDKDYKKLWGIMTTIYPGYNTYQTRTPRKLPVVRLHPISTNYE